MGSALLGTAELTMGMQITCWVLGAFSLVVNVALKQIPLTHFDEKTSAIKWPDLEGEDKNDQVAAGLAKMGSMYRRKVDDLMSAGA